MAPSGPSIIRGKSSRQASRKISYKEKTFTSGSKNEDSEVKPPCRKRSSSHSVRKRRISLLGQSGHMTSVKRARNITDHKEDAQSDQPGVQQEIIPRWQDLPYDILASIFLYTYPSKTAKRGPSWDT